MSCLRYIHVHCLLYEHTIYTCYTLQRERERESPLWLTSLTSSTTTFSGIDSSFRSPLELRSGRRIPGGTLPFPASSFVSPLSPSRLLLLPFPFPISERAGEERRSKVTYTYMYMNTCMSKNNEILYMYCSCHWKNLYPPLKAPSVLF